MAIQTEHSLQLGVEIKKKLKEFDLDISFSAGKGCLGILGPSGCGKSMTLKSIAGIVTPDSGRIALQYAKGELGALAVWRIDVVSISGKARAAAKWETGKTLQEPTPMPVQPWLVGAPK